MINRLGLDKNTEELRKLILENPGLPIVVLAGEEANIDCGFMYCSCISFDIEENEIMGYVPCCPKCGKELCRGITKYCDECGTELLQRYTKQPEILKNMEGE